MEKQAELQHTVEINIRVIITTENREYGTFYAYIDFPWMCAYALNCSLITGYLHIFCEKRSCLFTRYVINPK